MKTRYHMTTCYLENCCLTFTIEQIERGEVLSLLNAGWSIKSRDRFTGLRDSKRTAEYPEGQDIYEGDIAKIHLTGDAYIIAKVGWIDGCLCWVAPHFCVTIKEVVFNTRNSNVEIIGSIHDNPDLLTEA